MSLHKILAGTKVFCIDLQENVTFERDIIVEVTQYTPCKKFGFGSKRELLFNCPGMIPGLIKSRGEFSVKMSDLEDFKIPEFQNLTMKIG